MHRPVLWLSLLALATGLFLRLLLASRLHAPWGDNGATVLEVARNLREGRGYTTWRVWTFFDQVKAFPHPEGNRQPLLATLVAGAWAVEPLSFRAAQAVPLLGGVAVMVLCLLIARAWGGPWAGCAAAWLVALDPPLVYFSAQVEDQILFTALFLGLLLAHLRLPGSPWLPWVAGVHMGLLYLTRTNGLLVALSVCLVWVWRGWRRQALLAALVATVVALPWLVRTAKAFGNPFHTDNSYFLWSETFWDVFALRDTPPSWRTYLASHSLGQVAGRWLKGAYLCAEDFVLGNLFKAEPFARGSMVPFLLLALPCFRRHAGSLAFVGICLLAHVVSLSWHAHGTFRYFLPFFTVALVGAGCGVVEAWRWVGGLPPRVRRSVLGTGLALFVLSTARPMVHTFRSDARVHEEAMEVVDWISRHTADHEPVMAFPVVEKYLYLYRRPTVMIPSGPLAHVWEVACRYGVRYLVASAEAVRWLPALGELWSTSGTRVVACDLPSFLEPVATTSGGMFRVYRIHLDHLCP